MSTNVTSPVADSTTGTIWDALSPVYDCVANACTVGDAVGPVTGLVSDAGAAALEGLASAYSASPRLRSLTNVCINGGTAFTGLLVGATASNALSRMDIQSVDRNFGLDMRVSNAGVWTGLGSGVAGIGTCLVATVAGGDEWADTCERGTLFFGPVSLIAPIGANLATQGPGSGALAAATDAVTGFNYLGYVPNMIKDAGSALSSYVYGPPGTWAGIGANPVLRNLANVAWGVGTGAHASGFVREKGVVTGTVAGLTDGVVMAAALSNVAAHPFIAGPVFAWEAGAMCYRTYSTFVADGEAEVSEEAIADDGFRTATGALTLLVAGRLLRR